MGAWGTGSFENDGALDFGSDVAASDDGALLVRHQLELTCAPGSVDAPAAEASLAAAELVAAARGCPGSDLPPPLAEWVRLKAPGFGESDCQLALAACDRVASGSELRELWLEAGEDGQAWNAAVDELRARLRQALGDAAGGAPLPGTEPWRLWEPLDPATASTVAALFERFPALASAVEIRVAIYAAVKSQNQFDADLALRLTITPGGDVTVEFAGLEETFTLDEEAAAAEPAGDGPAIAIGPANLADFLTDLMADRVCVVHRYEGDELQFAFAVRTEALEAGIAAALATPPGRGRRLLGRKRPASAVVVSWTGQHDREVQAT